MLLGVEVCVGLRLGHFGVLPFSRLRSSDLSQSELADYSATLLVPFNGEKPGLLEQQGPQT